MTPDAYYFPEPNPDFLADWIAALRSGEYKQATGGLVADQGFCCLGVACDVFAKKYTGDHIEAEWTDYTFKMKVHLATEGDASYETATSEHETELPRYLARLLGFGSNYGAYGADRSDRASLISLNDDDGKTFPEIADAIEANMEALRDYSY